MDGNDFHILEHPAGFSVNRLSKSVARCHPVLSDDCTSQLTGYAATGTLIKRLRVLPPISIDIKASDELRHSFRVFESIALARARRETRAITERLRAQVRYLIPERNLGGIAPHLELSDLFDRDSGAIIFRDLEIEQMRDNKSIQEIFDFNALDQISADWAGPRYCMFTDTAVIARGPDYYFSLTREDENANFVTLLKQADSFIERATVFLDTLDGRRIGFILYKVVLAILDNLRNFALTIHFPLVESRTKSARHFSGRLAYCFYSEVIVKLSDINFELLLGEHKRFDSVKLELLALADRF